MKAKNISSLAICILASLLILVPLYILPPCPGLIETAAGQYVPMKCFWTVRAETGIGCVIAFGGLALFLTKDRGQLTGIFMMLSVCAVFAGALPLFLIGMCASPLMPCRMGTQPALILLSSVLFLVSAGHAFYLSRGNRE